MAICVFLQSIAPAFSYTHEVHYPSIYASSESVAEVSSDETTVLPEEEEVIFTAPPSGGPDQPETQSFTPIGTSDMVDPFTGDFSYNIPLMDIDGYPINIAYNSGVTMDQEATWVGLGWSLNPGVVNRAMRGIPDDFDGTDEVIRERNMRRNWTFGVSSDLETETFGINLGKLASTTWQDSVSLYVSLGLSYNNYTGYDGSFGFGGEFSIAKKDKPSYGIGLGLSGSSQSGPSLSPSISMRSEKEKQEGKEAVTKKLNIGSSFNSRGGWSNLNIGYSRSSKLTETGKRAAMNNKFTDLGPSFGVSSTFNLGQSSFTPTVDFAYNSYGFTGKYSMGTDWFGVDPSLSFKGFYHARWLKENTLVIPAYGYLNSNSAQSKDNVMMDYNRENDGTFTKNTPAIAIPSMTYDIFSVSGQGIGGSYRLYRNDIGYVYDRKTGSNSVSNSVGIELNLGSAFKGGADINGVYTNSQTKPWRSNNQVDDVLGYKQTEVRFREANEMSVDMDQTLFNTIGGDKAARFNLTWSHNLKNTLEGSDGTPISSSTTNISDYSKTGEEKRNQVIYTQTIGQLKQGYGLEPLHAQSYAQSTDDVNHHIGEFTTLNTDGTRYVYGIAAYSHEQKTVSFAVGATNSTNALNPDCTTGRIAYPVEAASLNNEWGRDHFYDATTTPAFAHSYLLTHVLNADYVDADNIPGPSKGDLGGYVEFEYVKIDNYQWRNPINQLEASFNEGLNADPKDDRANYTWGEKELWYVKRILTKNHIAVFYTSDRKDGRAVLDENGGVDPTGPSMQKLDSIKLYALPDYENDPQNAIPLKVVHFEYDYSLCENYDQNIFGAPDSTGKLTLKKVYFTYQGSNKGAFSPYTFEYAENPGYDVLAQDRWGNYQPRTPSCGGEDIAADPLRNSDFPYVGFDKTNVDKYVAAWSLSTINLPSGGRIEVVYESDDYAYVQHKRAQQMFKIIGVYESATPPTYNDLISSGTTPISDSDFENRFLFFELIPGYDSPADVDKYFSGIDKVYFRALMKFGDNMYDFVPGYAELGTNPGPKIINFATGEKVGMVPLVGATLEDNGSSIYNPIAVAAIQFGRLNLSSQLPPSNQSQIDETAGIVDAMNALGGAFTSFGELITGPNKALWNRKIGTQMEIGKSWVRLNNPDGHKLGGGCRVKRIEMYDSWDAMTGDVNAGFSYGQEYFYELEDGRSSGVASYEPQLGGDENVWRQPVANDTKNLLAPDIRNYQEEPFGEQFFPTPRVGYSRIVMRNLQHTGVNRTATGHVVNEFYTAKDFPTIVKRTNPAKTRYKLPLFTYFLSVSIDELSLSQGFVIENNDMHGKPKLQAVYAEGQTEPITKMEYFYQSEPMSFNGIPAKHLTNDATVITPQGTVANATIGRTYEAVADFRKMSSNMISGSMQFNLNVSIPFPIVPTGYPTGSYERTAFRSAAFVKVIERFGILEKVVATDLGSVVETNNLAYDSETGAVLLTQTTTDFNDKVYNFTYPAHWYYDGMSQAYTTIESSIGLGTFVNGIVSTLGADFSVGDEVKYIPFGQQNAVVGWVTAATPNSIQVMLKDGTYANGDFFQLEVTRSGRRNLQSTPIGTIVLRDNPLDNLSGNIFEQVLQAGAVEFADEWRTFCECFLDENNEFASTNPYVLGLKGTWRPKASYVHLSGRTQSFENGNSNIRQDGMFTSFTPFYRITGGDWQIDRKNWTYTSSVVEFSPYGQALETIDALNRYSSSMFGYNQTLPTAVAANTRYRQLGFDGFEDYDYDNCSDNHFRVADFGGLISGAESHTGRKSIRVTAGTPVTLSASLVEDCEYDESCMLVEQTITMESCPSGCPEQHLETASLTPSQGVGPYQFDYQIVSGSATIDIDENGTLFIENTQSEHLQIIITVTDAAGCVEVIDLNY